MAKGKKKKKGGGFLSTLLLIIALGVFAYSAWQLYGYYVQYKAGSDEYDSLSDQFAEIDEGDDAGDAGEAGTGSDEDSLFAGDVTPSSQTGGAEGGTEADGTQALTESVAGEDGTEAEAASGTAAAAKVIRSVTSLEDPDTIEEVLAQAGTVETVENDEVKSLPTLLNPIDFAKLNALNDEVIGWIRIGAVDISYPIAQAEDNDFYLHRTFLKEDNFAGCIFLNCDNSRYFTDQNTIVYGHNMRNLSMFGKLKRFAEQETFDKNPYIWIFTADFIYQYRIFSTSIVNRVGDPYRTTFSEEDFQAFIDESIESSEIDCGDVEVTTDDRVITLSTCTGDDTTRRIVQGVLEQIYIAENRHATVDEDTIQ